MSHNLNEDGKRMFYVGERPWHGLGTKLDNPATAKEAIEVANLDYDVELQPIYLKDGVEIEDRKATVRVDTNAPLGIVTEKYKVVGNREAFSFFDTVVGEGQAIYHTAGALGEGERIWILAKLPSDIVVGKDDVIEKYLILTNSHDGKSSLKMYFSPVRVVCQNTLNFSLHNKSDCINIIHSGNIRNKVDEARKVLGIAVDVYGQFEQIAKQLVDVKLDVAQANSYFNKLVFGKDAVDNTKTKLVNQKNTLLILFERGCGNDLSGIQYSAWGAYNAVTELVDHHKAIRGLKDDPSNRLKNIWFGSGASLKKKAYDEALVLAGIKK